MFLNTVHTIGTVVAFVIMVCDVWLCDLACEDTMYDFDTACMGSTFAPGQTDVFPRRYSIVCPSFLPLLPTTHHHHNNNNFKLDDKKEKLERSAILCTIIYPEVIVSPYQP